MKKRILSGMRPTGRLHLGNYVGALENWIKLQNEYESFHMVADWHMLTTDLKHTGEVQENSIQVVIDWLAAGLDPVKSPIFIQSHVKEHAELHFDFLYAGVGGTASAQSHGQRTGQGSGAGRTDVLRSSGLPGASGGDSVGGISGLQSPCSARG